jgi:hypothetical protein
MFCEKCKKQITDDSIFVFIVVTGLKRIMRFKVNLEMKLLEKTSLEAEKIELFLCQKA